MRVSELVGKLALRRSETIKGGQMFLTEPVLILSYDARYNIGCVCLLESNGTYEAGVPINLSADYMDGEWLDYGPLVNTACQTKAQLIQMILSILGIQADSASLRVLCKATAYKQLYAEISDQLDLKDIINSLSTTDVSQEEPAPRVGAPQNSETTTWGNLMNNNPKPSFGAGFVRRSI